MVKNVLLLAMTSFIAQGVVLVPPGSWISYENLTPSGNVLSGTGVNANTYWNKASQDNSSCANIGCFITKQSFYASNVNSPNIDKGVYLAQNSVGNEGKAISDFIFSQPIDSTKPVTLLLEEAGFRNKNWLGWYESGYSAFSVSDYGKKWGVIFDGKDGVAQSRTITMNPGQNFGFWALASWQDANFVPFDGAGKTVQDVSNALLSPSDGAVFTESARNKGEEDGGEDYLKRQYYSVFARSATSNQFWVGLEDLAKGDFGNGGDFNDLVFSITIVPEPGFYGALALGLAGIYMAVRRKKA